MRKAFGSWLLGCAVAGAQTRISMRSEPKPDQSIHVTSTLAMSINLDGAAAGQPATSVVMTETLLGYTQTNGRFDDQGRMELQLTIERFDIKQSLDGNVKSSANIGDLVGGSMTAVVDRQGKLVDLRVPKELEQVLHHPETAGGRRVRRFEPAPRGRDVDRGVRDRSIHHSGAAAGE